jgi:hypothetical protein
MIVRCGCENEESWFHSVDHDCFGHKARAVDTMSRLTVVFGLIFIELYCVFIARFLDIHTNRVVVICSMSRHACPLVPDT